MFRSLLVVLGLHGKREEGFEHKEMIWNFYESVSSCCMTCSQKLPLWCFSDDLVEKHLVSYVIVFSRSNG